MTDRDALGHLRQVHLSPIEIKMLTQLAVQGGEGDWFPLADKPQVPLINQCLDLMVTKRLVEFISPNTRMVIAQQIAPAPSSVVAAHGPRIRVRLTDGGRAVNAQLDAMSMRPKLEVPSAS